MEQFAHAARLARMTAQSTGEAAHGVAASARDLVKVYGKGEAEVGPSTG